MHNQHNDRILVLSLTSTKPDQTQWLFSSSTNANKSWYWQMVRFMFVLSWMNIYALGFCLMSRSFDVSLGSIGLFQGLEVEPIAFITCARLVKDARWVSSIWEYGRWVPVVNSAKKKKRPLFQDPVFQRQFIKIQITSQIFIVKGLNMVSHACSMNHKQLMNMHLWNGR